MLKWIAIIHRLFKLYGKEYREEIAPMTIQEFGNSSVATVPTMYDRLKRQNARAFFQEGRLCCHGFSRCRHEHQLSDL